jgi:hypothetical protein
MKFLKQNYTVFFIIALSSLAFASFFLCEYKTQPVAEVQPSKELAGGAAVFVPEIPNMTIKNLRLCETDKTKAYELVLTATESKFFHTNSKIECEDVQCEIKKSATMIAWLAAKKSFIDRQAKKIFLAGDVQGNLKNIHIVGSDIDYDFATHVIRTNKEMVYTHEQISFSAQRSVIHIKKNKISMSGGVRSVFLGLGLKI